MACCRYYLHLLDKVQGAAHFDVPEPIAQVIAADMRGRLPGYTVPRLVREVAGAPAKSQFLTLPRFARNHSLP